jgi:hypothetical protein
VAVFTGAADSSATTDDVAPSDATTTDRASPSSPIPAAKGRGAFDGIGDPPMAQGGWEWLDFMYVAFPSFCLLYLMFGP